MDETLPQILERRRGVPQRTTWIVALLLILLGVAVYVLFIRDPLEGNDEVVHLDKPVFTMLLTPGRVRNAPPRNGELIRIVGRRGPVRAMTTVRRLHLPAYEGDVAGMLPVFTDAHTRALAARIENFKVTIDGKARVHTAPGYQVGFTYGTPDLPGEGIDILLVPPEEPGVRDGVILSYRAVRPVGRIKPHQRKVLKAMRSAFRSFEFGPDRF